MTNYTKNCKICLIRSFRCVRLNQTNKNVEYEPEHTDFFLNSVTLGFNKAFTPSEFPHSRRRISLCSFGLTVPLDINAKKRPYSFHNFIQMSMFLNYKIPTEI